MKFSHLAHVGIVVIIHLSNDLTWKQWHCIFHSMCSINDKDCRVIVDNESCKNFMVKKWWSTLPTDPTRNLIIGRQVVDNCGCLQRNDLGVLTLSVILSMVVVEWPLNLIKTSARRLVPSRSIFWITERWMRLIIILLSTIILSTMAWASWTNITRALSWGKSTHSTSYSVKPMIGHSSALTAWTWKTNLTC